MMVNREKWFGKILDGFCDGFFYAPAGVSKWDDKVIEAIGRDWIVVRYENGMTDFAYFAPGWQYNEMEELLEEWSRGW